MIERKRKVKDKNIKNPTVKNTLKMSKNNKNKKFKAQRLKNCLLVSKM